MRKIRRSASAGGMWKRAGAKSFERRNGRGAKDSHTWSLSEKTFARSSHMGIMFLYHGDLAALLF
jgi:hypothetical protein